MKKTAYIIGLTLLVLTGCQVQAPPPDEISDQEGVIEVVDPKAEAEAQLLQELGLDSGEIKIQKDTLDFPSVLPTPPELPATDADILDLGE